MVRDISCANGFIKVSNVKSLVRKQNSNFMSTPTPTLSSTISSPATQADPPSIHRLKNLLRETIRVTVTDGRIFIGTFAGTDQPLNIVLLNTEEFRRGVEEEGVMSGRYIGQVMVPWRLVVKVEAFGTPDKEDAHDNARALFF